MKRLHRAWAICLGCTLMLFVCGGLSVNAFSVTQPYVLAYGGFTNTQTSMINTIRALSYLGCMFAAPLFFRTLGYRLGTAVAVAFSGRLVRRVRRLQNAGRLLSRRRSRRPRLRLRLHDPRHDPDQPLVPPEKGPRHRTLLRKHRTRHDRLFSDPHGDLRNARAASLLPRRGRVLPRLRGAGLPARPRVA